MGGTRFTDRELDVMGILWELRTATVSEVRERLEDDLAYNTVLTTLRNMEQKGHVGHEVEGRAHRYFPRVNREVAGEEAVDRVLETIFGGSTERLLTHLVGRDDVEGVDLEALRSLVDQRLESDSAEEDT